VGYVVSAFVGTAVIAAVAYLLVVIVGRSRSRSASR
jgi:hypothetical protein